MDLDTIQVVVMDGEKVNTHLITWVRKFPHFTLATDIASKPFPDMVAVWRNGICAWFLQKTELDHLLMIDADMVPLPDTKPVWSEDAPILGCDTVNGRGHRTHDQPGHVGCGCIRMSREALESIPKPWFMFEFDDNGLKVTQCECGYFCEKAMASGFHPVKSGKMGHIMPAVVSPNGDSAHIQLLSRWKKE